MQGVTAKPLALPMAGDSDVSDVPDPAPMTDLELEAADLSVAEIQHRDGLAARGQRLDDTLKVDGGRPSRETHSALPSCLRTLARSVLARAAASRLKAHSIFGSIAKRNMR